MAQIVRWLAFLKTIAMAIIDVFAVLVKEFVGGDGKAPIVMSSMPAHLSTPMCVQTIAVVITATASRELVAVILVIPDSSVKLI